MSPNSKSAFQAGEKGWGIISANFVQAKWAKSHWDQYVMVYELNDAFSYDKYKKLRWQAWAGLQFGLFRSGPATSNIIEGGAFWYGDKAARFPDLQLFFFPGAGIEPGMGEVPSGNGCTIDFMQAKPKSRGTLRLRSSDPFSAPAIDPNYLAEEHDLSCLVEGVKMGEEIMRHPAIARYLRRCFVPNEKLETRRDYEEFVRREAQPGIHPTGTCRFPVLVLSLQLPS